jgi:NAD(P)H-flavin reductase
VSAAAGTGIESCAAATSGRYRVVERRSFGRYALLTLLAPELARAARPGQFVMAAVPGAAFHLRRPLSIHSIAGERLRLLVEPRGAGTLELAAAGVADTLALAGPLGNGFPLDGVTAALLVGGGIGVAPLQAVADALRARDVATTAAFGFRDAAQARLAGAFEIADLWVATDDGSVGRRASAVELAAEVRARLRPRTDAGRRAALGGGRGSPGLRVARGAHGLRHRRLSRLRGGDHPGVPAGLRRGARVPVRPAVRRARRGGVVSPARRWRRRSAAVVPNEAS